MCKAAMPPEVLIVDAEMEADDVDAQNDRTGHTQNPYALQHSGLGKRRPEAKCSYRMREG